MQQAKRSWLLSDAGNSVLNALSWMTLVVLVLGISASTMLPSGETYLGNSPALKVAAWAIFVVFSAVVIGEFVLWCSMLWFCLRYLTGGPIKRLLCLVLQLVGFSVASAALYFAVYRQQRRRSETGASAM